MGANATTIMVSAWPRDYIPRQLVSVFILSLIGVVLLYFSTAWASYHWFFDHDVMNHPKFLKNQVRKEIMCSLKAFPGMIALTLPWFMGHIHGYSKLYDGLDTYGYAWLICSVPAFLLFTDFLIYWVHRLEHHPALYKHCHKLHHKWVVPTPFSSHAFHPMDGYLQSVPYHLFVVIFPMHRMLFLCLFGFVNFWAILIHDSDMLVGHPLESVINGPAHHTLHHMYFTVNYGQYFTWADRVWNSYKQPEAHMDPLIEARAAMKAKGK
ncbi:C5-sterol desaturase [Cylindrobasidium torrendii FP15055 ss-10]|uniref:C5-sterol desaturase n=1 Tax=Cylindrobasidium torrendii FP15055 ss-10 TaxID=1314674 RepID=A0A0D7BNZ9_9AGAR|nr:C5-sterol desaturase [Cylindrobasidium torrendii FP15055 ss-10]